MERILGEVECGSLDPDEVYKTITDALEDLRDMYSDLPSNLSWDFEIMPDTLDNDGKIAGIVILVMAGILAAVVIAAIVGGQL